MLRFALTAGLAGLLATAAVAQPSVPQSPTEPGMPSAADATVTSPSGAAVSDPDKVICKTVKPPTGTRVGSARNRTKMCMTKGEWDEQARQAQEQLNQRNSGICSGSECRD